MTDKQFIGEMTLRLQGLRRSGKGKMKIKGMSSRRMILGL